MPPAPPGTPPDGLTLPPPLPPPQIPPCALPGALPGDACGVPLAPDIPTILGDQPLSPPPPPDPVWELGPAEPAPPENCNWPPDPDPPAPPAPGLELPGAGEPCPVFGAVAPAVALINKPNVLGDADPAAPTVIAIGPGIAGAENVPIAVPPAPPPPEFAPPTPPLVDPPLPPAPNTVTRTPFIVAGFVHVAGAVYVFTTTGPPVPTEAGRLPVKSLAEPDVATAARPLTFAEGKLPEVTACPSVERFLDNVI